MALTVERIKFNDEPNHPYYGDVRVVTVLDAFSAQAPQATREETFIVDRCDGTYLVHSFDPEDSKKAFTAATAKERLGLQAAPEFNEVAIGPLNAAQTNAVLRITEARAAKKYFAHLAEQEAAQVNAGFEVAFAVAEADGTIKRATTSGPGGAG